MSTLDWATGEARIHLYYLRKCRDEAQELEYLAAALRLAESAGAKRGVEELAEVLSLEKT